MPLRIASALSGACLVILLIGCGSGTDLDVAEGRYRLYLKGHLTDTLSGPAIVRTQQNGHVGLELGDRDGSGLSIELARTPRSNDSANVAPPPVSAGRYDVVAGSLLDAPSADSLSGLLAFLSVADREFVATQGHLSVTETGDGMVGGTLEFEMAERESDTPGERTVRVTGVLRATAP